MQVQPLPGFTARKICLLILGNAEVLSKREITENYIYVLWKLGKVCNEETASSQTGKALKGLIESGQVKREGIGQYYITLNGVKALKKLDTDYGIPDKWRPRYLDNVTLSSKQKKGKI